MESSEEQPLTLFEQIASFENLWLAFRKASRGKRSRENVADFEYHLEGWLLRLQRQLQKARKAAEALAHADERACRGLSQGPLLLTTDAK